MAEAEKIATEELQNQEGAAPSSARGPLKLLLCVVLMVVTGGSLAVMAIPSKKAEYKVEGPFFSFLLFGDDGKKEDIVVSTPDGGGTRYLKFTLFGEYTSYEESYFQQRLQSPDYSNRLRERAAMIGSSRSLHDSAIGEERMVFSALLRKELEPIVFPVHIGDTDYFYDEDESSGLKPGFSAMSATFREYFHRGMMHVDGPARVLRLGDGPEVTFKGDEDDLEVRSHTGDTVYVDVTHYDPEFIGDVKVGVHGKLRRITVNAIGQ